MEITVYLTKYDDNWFIDETDFMEKEEYIEFENKMKEAVQKLVDEYINKDEVHCSVDGISIEG